MMQKLQGLRCRRTVTTQCTWQTAAASKQGRHGLVQNPVFAEGTKGALFLTLRAFFFFNPRKRYSNGVTNFKHWKGNVGGFFASGRCYN